MNEIWNRQKNRLEVEKTYKSAVFQFLYGNDIGYLVTKNLLARKWFGRLYGGYKSSFLSKKEIPEFIKSYNISNEDFLEKNYKSFNDYFAREFREGRREFPKANHHLGSPCEGRLLVRKDISGQKPICVKGVQLDIEQLLDSKRLGEQYRNSEAYIWRLAPIDYHRFHAPFSGEWSHIKTIDGHLHSVNPISLGRDPFVLLKNSRKVFTLNSSEFGEACFVLVGAFCVGSINVNKYKGNVKRGEDLGYFEFGGSTVIMLWPDATIKVEPDILENSLSNRECFIRLGEKFATIDQKT